MLCILCKDEFSNDPLKFPIVLVCDHLCCKECFTSLYGLKGNCPVCRDQVTFISDRSNVEKLINFAAAKNSTSLREIAVQRTATDFDKIINAIKEKLASLEEAITISNRLKVHEIFGKKIEIQRNHFINSIKKFEVIKETYYSNSPNYLDLNTYSKNYGNLLYKIIDQLVQGKKIYVAAYINEKMKYGEVQKYKNEGIMVNSLTLGEIKDDASYFWMHEFKKYFPRIWSFFTFPRNEESDSTFDDTLIFEIIDCQKKSGYLELCTGEGGKSFEDSEYVKTGNKSFEINIPRNYMNLKCGQKDLDICSSNDRETVMRVISSTKFEIKQLKKKEDCQSIVGRLRNPVPFDNLYPDIPSERKIKKCGLCVFKM